jgi:hypothetical protein
MEFASQMGQFFSELRRSTGPLVPKRLSQIKKAEIERFSPVSEARFIVLL